MKWCIPIAIIMLLASPVSAQEYVPSRMFCAPSEMFIKHLTEKKQAPVMFGIVNKGQAGVNVWRTADSSEWTITVVNPLTKMMCALGSGTDIQSVLWHLKTSGPKT